MYDDVVYKDKFIWNRSKNELNKRRHSISFETASLAFDDLLARVVYDFENSDYNEDRYKLTGFLMKRIITLKTQKDILAEIEAIKNSPIDYSDIHDMTDEERETGQFYYKDFLDKLPPEMVKSLIQQRLDAAKVPEMAGK